MRKKRLLSRRREKVRERVGDRLAGERRYEWVVGLSV